MTRAGMRRSQRPSPHQPQKQWQGWPPPAAQHAADHPILQEHLQALRKSGRQLPPPLHRVEVISGDRPLPERGGEDVGRRDGSWTARLMPTPPIGDMAWAASPMHNSPGRYHWRKRSTRTVRSLISHPARLDAAEALLRIAWPASQPHPQRIYRRAKVDNLEAGLFAHPSNGGHPPRR